MFWRMTHLELRREHKENYMEVGENEAWIWLQESSGYGLSWGRVLQRGLKKYSEEYSGISDVC